MFSTLGIEVAPLERSVATCGCHVGHCSSEIYLLGQLMSSAFWRGVTVLTGAVTCLGCTVGCTAFEEQSAARV